MKIAWCLLFAVSLIVYGALFFGAASGGSNSPPMMMAIWLAVAVGLFCGFLTIVGLFAGRTASGFLVLVPIVALWPLLWLGAAMLLSILR